MFPRSARDLLRPFAAALRALPFGDVAVVQGEGMRSPASVPDLVGACPKLLIDGGGSLWHFTTPGTVTRADLRRRPAPYLGLDPARVPDEATGSTVPDRALASARGQVMPDLDDPLARYGRDHEAFARRPDASAARNEVRERQTRATARRAS